jgi:VWFA-related protein
MKSATSIVFLTLFFLTVISASSHSQSTAPASSPATIHFFVSVRDKHGKSVSTLSKDEFVLTQDDHAQTIQSLQNDSDLPVTVGLIFDTGMNQAGALDRERSASHDFLDQTLRENKDKAFIIHFDHEVELLQDLTNSRDKLFNALGLLQAARPQFDDSSDSGEPGENRRGGGRGSVLYDAIYLACDELMKTQHDRKMLIVMSDGIDRNSKETEGSAVESAQRTGTPVYNAFSKAEENAPSEHRGFGFPRGGMGRPPGGQRRAPEESPAEAKKILEQVSKQTGGGFFEISKKDALEQAYHTIEDDLRHQYEITYLPQQSGDSSGFHKISLTTKQKDLVVQVPAGFYARK